jgi:hypothetical protein
VGPPQGVNTSTVSDVVAVDASPPSAGRAWVRDVVASTLAGAQGLMRHPYTAGQEVEVDFLPPVPWLACEFTNAQDPDSGIQEVHVCWGSAQSNGTTSPGGAGAERAPLCDVAPWRVPDPVAADSAGPLKATVELPTLLPVGRVVVCYVRWRSWAGATVFASSNGLRVTDEVPVLLAVLDGPDSEAGVDIDSQALGTMVAYTLTLLTTVPVHRCDVVVRVAASGQVAASTTVLGPTMASNGSIASGTTTPSAPGLVTPRWLRKRPPVLPRRLLAAGPKPATQPPPTQSLWPVASTSWR